MAEARIPVDLFNPGQVFACLGFLEAAEVLLGDAEGGFDWSCKTDVRFLLHAPGNSDPVKIVLEFLAECELKQLGPVGYDAAYNDKKASAKEEALDDDTEAEALDDSQVAIDLEETFPASSGDRMALPIRASVPDRPVVEIGHWADGSSRENFKLYAGNRSAYRIARSMLCGTGGRSKGKQRSGGIKGVAELWNTQRDALVASPFHVVTPMGGSFNFDPRGAWTAIDAGYSPNDQKHTIEASPVVEFLAAWGLENARPDEHQTRKVRYAAWGIELPTMLARAACVGAIPAIPYRRFRFGLNLSGKNKVVTFATPESNS